MLGDCVFDAYQTWLGDACYVAINGTGTLMPQANDVRPSLIVGIGASAGGLAAFKTFLANTPTDTGMAFVLVQHLDPQHKSLLVELLGASASMPVVEATDGVAV